MGHDAPEHLDGPGRPRGDLVDARPLSAPAAESAALDVLAERTAKGPVDARPAPVRPEAVQRLQLRAGNAAIAAMIQRRAAPPAAARRPTPVQRKPAGIPTSPLARLGGGAAGPLTEGKGASTEAGVREAGSSTTESSRMASPGAGLTFAAASPPPPDGATTLQRSMAEVLDRARRGRPPAGQAPSGPEDTGSVEGDVDRSDFTKEPELAAADRKANPPPPPPPKPATPSAVIEAKNVPPAPPKPPAKKVGKALVAGPKGKGHHGGTGARPAPAPGEVVKKPAPPLPPPYVKPKKAGAQLPPPPAPPKQVKPKQDPAFAKVVTAAKMTVKQAHKHPKGKDEAANAQGAAVAPANDIDAQAKANRADTMATAKPKPFDEDAFVAAVTEAMRKSAPKNLDETDDVGDKVDGVKGAIGEKVAQGKDAAAGDVEAKSEQPPDPATATPKPVTPLGPLEIEQPGGMQASGAMPAPVGNEQVDFRHGPAKVDNEMASSNVTEEQLAESNEPEFTGALDAKKEGEEHSQQAPADVRKAEAGILKQAAAASAADEKKTVGDARSSIGGAVAKIAGQKDETKSKDELKRKEVADHINSIFDKTKSDVDEILDGIETKVDKAFTNGEAAIRQAFTADWNARLDQYKDDRYSGLRGGYRWVRDKFRGLPAAANALFDRSKKLYEENMQKLIRGIAKTVSSELNRATVRIEQGRGEVSTYVASLKGDLAKFGQEAAADMADKFDTLDSSVKDKFDDLAGSLAKRYQESQAAVAEEIEAAQEANKGLIDKAIDAVKGVIRVINQLKEMILNVLSRIASVMGDIIAHPIKFLKNFVSAVKAGITRFMNKIGEHLQKGLMGWLFGALDAKGIEIPDSFSIEGIFKLVLSVLGVTWGLVREKIAKKIGEPAMAALETGADIIKKVVVGGPGVLWEMLLEKFSEFQEMVIGEIKNFVIEKVVKSGITFLISLLNPAAAFIKACKMIYDVVMFFVEKGSEIKEFVDTIIDAAGDVARGGEGGIAEKIEGVLAKLLPLAISFLANVLGLGGVGEKVHSIIDKVRKPIHKAMDKVIDVVVKMTAPIWKPAKALFDKGKKLYGKAKDKVVGAYEAGKAKVKQVGSAVKDVAKAGYDKVKTKVKQTGAWVGDKAKGVGKKVGDTAKAAKDKVVGWVKPQPKPTSMDGAAHTISAEPNKKGRFSIYMASAKELLTVKIDRTVKGLEERAAAESGKTKQETLMQINELLHMRQTAQLLEDLNPEQKATHMEAPPGFEKEMRELSEKVKQFGDKNDLKDIAPGTRVDLRMLARFGLPLPSYLQAQEIADDESSTIDVRPTAVGAPELLAQGLSPKSDKFKQKTMNKDDELLGLPPEYRDRVVWFLPSRPKPENFKDYPPEVLRAVWLRWRQRKDEYNANIDKMKSKLREGQVAVKKIAGAARGGTIEGGHKAIDELVKGVGITGDHDVYEVHGNVGRVIKRLEDPPFRVQHGAHRDWPTTVREAEKRDLDPEEQRIFDAIVSKHLPGGEPLLRINPKAPPTTANSSKQHYRYDQARAADDDVEIHDAKEPASGAGPTPHEAGPAGSDPTGAGAPGPGQKPTGLAAIWAKAEEIARAKTKAPLADTKALAGVTKEVGAALKGTDVKKVEAKASAAKPGTHKIVAQRAEQTIVDGIQAGPAVEANKPLSLTMSPAELKASPAAQKELFERATEARARQEAFARAVIGQVGASGEVKSILKRDDFTQFIDGILEKCKRNKYSQIGQMDDMVRGRFNLGDGQQVEKVAKALEAQSQFTVKEVVKPRREVVGVGHGYPRYHVILVDSSGLTHEWQVGTAAVSKLYETIGIKIPSTVELKVGMKNDIHDIEYDILKGIEKTKGMAKFAREVGIPQVRRRVDRVAAECGTKGDAVRNLEEKIRSLHLQISAVLAKVVERKGPNFVKQFYH